MESILQGAAETVLIVEDEDILRKLLVQILESNGYKVLQAANGTEAIAVGQGFADRIDLLLTDVEMPGMNGSELAKQLKLHNPEMKVLLMSGNTENWVSHHGAIPGGASFIGKPFTPMSLARKIREILDKA
jgi:CheY-like chemotaxis protein